MKTSKILKTELTKYKHRYGRNKIHNGRNKASLEYANLGQNQNAYLVQIRAEKLFG